MKIVVLLGRILFAGTFLLFGPMHFTHALRAYAASAGVPMASIAVPIAGVLCILGALSVLLGYKAKIGVWFLVLFLIPVTLFMHNFWAVHDPMMRQMQMANFFKNLSMLGGALLIAYFGSGPFSLDGSGK